MAMTVVFLPDFVAYPLCYLGLQSQLPAGAPVAFVDYNRHWPYHSVPELVDAVASGLVADTPHAIVGYSFGAHVATLLGEQLARAGDASQLVLIDPPILAAMPTRDSAEIEVLLRGRDDYRYIFDAVDCELTSLECMVANIELLSRLPSRRRLSAPTTLFVAGGTAAADAVVAELDVAAALEVVCISHCDHRSILQDPAVVGKLVSIVERT
jgi:thioesterase domain-containing protein